jgi:hypothetical protein
MTDETTFIQINLHLPDHALELYRADEIIIKLKIKLDTFYQTESILPKEHTIMYEEIIRILDYVGNLSQSVFNIEEKLEKEYTLQYHHAPELGKKLYWDHYETLHHPYTILKNRCFRLLEDLDAIYIKCNKSEPPNWKI